MISGTRYIWRLATLIAFPLCLCRAESLKIGLLAHPQEPDARSMEQGARLAIEHANQLPGAKGELVVRGRPGQWGTEGDEAAALALDESVSGMIAPPGGAASHQVLQVAGRTRVPVVTLCGDSSVTSSGIPWVLRITPRSDLEAQTIFAGVTNAHTLHRVRIGKLVRWAVIIPEGRAGREAAKDLQSAAKNAGCALAEPASLPREVQAWPHKLMAFVTANPEAVLLWVDPVSAGIVAKVLRSLGYQGQLAGPSRLNSVLFFKNAGGAAEGFMIPGILNHEPSPFAEKYRQQFGSDPDFTATMAYDAAALLVQVLRQSPDLPPYRAFPLKKPFPGVSGPLIFDKDGNRQLTLQLLVCRKGSFVPK